MREAVLSPIRQPLKGMPRINALPTTDAHRKRLYPKKVKPPKLFAPTVQAVKKIVPDKFIQKLNPTPTRQSLH